MRKEIKIIISIIITIIIMIIFRDVYKEENVVIEIINKINVSKEYGKVWKIIKKIYPFTQIIVNYFILSKINIKIRNEKKENIDKEDELKILIGMEVKSNKKVYLKEKSLFQSILITGATGTGKTTSCICPFLKQMILYENQNEDKKIGLLILDVKGNLKNEIKEYVKQANREKDLIILRLNGRYKYNPIDKKEIRPQVLSNRMKTVLTLFAKENGDSYWLEKSEQILTESIKLCRLYNKGYVNFNELYKIINIDSFYREKIIEIQNKLNKNGLQEKEKYELKVILDFFEEDFLSLDSRTKAILKSEINRILMPFISDFDINNTFSPNDYTYKTKKIEEILLDGKIIIFDMSISEYKNIAKIIGAYLKLDFQNTILRNIKEKNSDRITGFICDEYQEFVTDTDTDFFSQSREGKCINIISTQSYMSLVDSIKNETKVKVILQNLVNKIWFKTDDIYTIEMAQKQIGKEIKTRESNTITENTKESKYSYILKTFLNRGSNISESITRYEQNEFLYDTKDFSRNIKMFETIALFENDKGQKEVMKLKMCPSIKKEEMKNEK